jgi:rhomboid family GlyGly-CTERM serine protease
MTSVCSNQIGGGPQARPRHAGTEGVSPVHFELLTFSVLLAVCNLPALRAQLSFSPSAVAAGQWWRVITHPFVHVSWYHLLLDGSAFLLLYQSLRGPRVAYVTAAGAGSLLASLWFWPAIGTTGLCGLSGIAHGLMAVSALEMIHQGERRVGWTCLALVAGKSIWEAATGQVVFSFLHFGLMGTPVAVCHLGGVVGGAAAFTLRKW